MFPADGILGPPNGETTLWASTLMRETHISAGGVIKLIYLADSGNVMLHCCMKLYANIHCTQYRRKSRYWPKSNPILAQVQS